MSARTVLALSALALGLLAGRTGSSQTPDLGSETQRAEGRRLYEKFCAQCHGVEGNGQGVAAPHLKPKPRDFTTGKYKIRTTPSGALPTDDDLKNIIRRGMPYTSMPAWPQFSETQLQNLVYHLKTYSDDFSDPEVPQGMTVPNAPEKTAETVDAGRGVYEQLGCAGCHGELGRGDGTSASTLTDDWGNHIRPADLTAKWTFRGGASRRDLFRTFSTGLNGTPMPSYRDALSDEERWQLVDYVDSLSESEEPPYSTLLVAKPLAGDLDLTRGAELFAGAESAMFPVVGQIMQPGRNFHPLITNVRVRAVYGATEIAFLVQWNDSVPDTSGTNDPTLAMPLVEEEAVTEPAAAADDFWGDETVEDDTAGDDFWGDEEATETQAGHGDAVAIQLPVGTPEGVAKPYFLFGDAERPVELWFVDLATSGEVRRYTGRGSGALTPLEPAEVEATFGYDRGQWSALFKRDLRSADAVAFDQGKFVPIAFSVWDGFNEERGNRRGLTQWSYLYVEPREQRSIVGPMIRAAVAVLVIELVLIFWIRWSRRRRDRAAKNGDPAYA